MHRHGTLARNVTFGALQNRTTEPELGSQQARHPVDSLVQSACNPVYDIQQPSIATAAAIATSGFVTIAE